MARNGLVLLVLILGFSVLLTAGYQTMRTLFPRIKYSPLYREHVFTKLSEKGKEIFGAINIHPSCLKKKGVCMKRGECKGPDMLYISRICYLRDLVCCYDSHYIPTVARNRPEDLTDNDTLPLGNVSYINDTFLMYQNYDSSEYHNIFVNIFNGTINETINDTTNDTTSTYK